MQRGRICRPEGSIGRPTTDSTPGEQTCPRTANSAARVWRCFPHHDPASAAEPFACAINAQELLGIEPGDSVAAFRAGTIGCMHISIAPRSTLWRR